MRGWMYGLVHDDHLSVRSCQFSIDMGAEMCHSGPLKGSWLHTATLIQGYRVVLVHRLLPPDMHHLPNKQTLNIWSPLLKVMGTLPRRYGYWRIHPEPPGLRIIRQVVEGDPHLHSLLQKCHVPGGTAQELDFRLARMVDEQPWEHRLQGDPLWHEETTPMDDEWSRWLMIAGRFSSQSAGRFFHSRMHTDKPSNTRWIRESLNRLMHDETGENCDELSPYDCAKRLLGHDRARLNALLDDGDRFGFPEGWFGDLLRHLNNFRTL